MKRLQITRNQRNPFWGLQTAKNLIKKVFKEKMLYQTQSLQEGIDLNHSDSNEMNFTQESMQLRIIQQMQADFAKRERELLTHNQVLKNKLSDTLKKKDIIEANYDSLVNEVQDLKTIIRRVYDEGELNAKKLKQRIQLQENQIQGLQKSLANLINDQSHYQAMRDYDQYCQEHPEGEEKHPTLQ